LSLACFSELSALRPEFFDIFFSIIKTLLSLGSIQIGVKEILNVANSKFPWRIILLTTPINLWTVAIFIGRSFILLRGVVLNESLFRAHKLVRMHVIFGPLVMQLNFIFII